MMPTEFLPLCIFLAHRSFVTAVGDGCTQPTVIKCLFHSFSLKHGFELIHNNVSNMVLEVILVQPTKLNNEYEKNII